MIVIVSFSMIIIMINSVVIIVIMIIIISIIIIIMNMNMNTDSNSTNSAKFMILNDNVTNRRPAPRELHGDRGRPPAARGLRLRPGAGAAGLGAL